MKVKELIEQLKTLDPEMNVGIRASSSMGQDIILAIHFKAFTEEERKSVLTVYNKCRDKEIEKALEAHGKALMKSPAHRGEIHGPFKLGKN